MGDNHEDDHDHYMVALIDEKHGIIDTREFCQHDLPGIHTEEIHSGVYMTAIAIPNQWH